MKNTIKCMNISNKWDCTDLNKWKKMFKDLCLKVAMTKPKIDEDIFIFQKFLLIFCFVLNYLNI